MRTTSALTLALAVMSAAISPVAAMAQQTPTPKQPPASSPQQQPSSPPPANQIDSTRPQQNEKGLTEFWTPERLREARPMPTPSVPTPSVQTPSVEPDEAKK